MLQVNRFDLSRKSMLCSVALQYLGSADDTLFDRVYQRQHHREPSWMSPTWLDSSPEI
jgi:hypothetical protein